MPLEENFEPPQHPMRNSIRIEIGTENGWKTDKKPITTDDCINFGLKIKNIETVSDLLES